MVIGTAVGRSIAPRSSSATAPLSSPVGAAGNRIAEEFAPRLQGRPHEFCPMWSIRYDIEQGQLPGSKGAVAF
jgi:hypothetical protein